jgi:16S rRNA (guanine527-N7)-methyltransferase
MDETYINSYLAKLPFDLPQDMANKIQVYLELLAKWNKAYNLTAIRTQEQMLTHHILDSLIIATYIEGPRILDVGTGPGFPGLPLAMMMSDQHFILLDSNSKKTRFVNQVVMELGLENIEVVTSRVENYTPDQGMNTVVSRAFTSLDEFVQKTSRFCVKKGLLIAMKGRYPTEEISSLPPDTDPEVIKLEVPDLDAERHLLLVRI